MQLGAMSQPQAAMARASMPQGLPPQAQGLRPPMSGPQAYPRPPGGIPGFPPGIPPGMMAGLNTMPPQVGLDRWLG